jgi:hypothetical protein
MSDDTTFSEKFRSGNGISRPQKRCTEYTIYAEPKLADIGVAQGGRPGKRSGDTTISGPVKLSDIGLSKDESARLKALAETPAPILDAIMWGSSARASWRHLPVIAPGRVEALRIAPVVGAIGSVAPWLRGCASSAPYRGSIAGKLRPRWWFRAFPTA